MHEGRAQRHDPGDAVRAAADVHVVGNPAHVDAVDGLLRRVGRNPARYEAVPLTAVDEAANLYRLKKKRTKKRRSSRSRLSCSCLVK